ncbi:MAG: peptide ABC transporter substrate-binding protein [Termitinemataceae bacterium]|nr:MAG: peptide ABC transporter substrate-binding protein [Termitinemataceae bacterium]
MNNLNGWELMRKINYVKNIINAILSCACILSCKTPPPVPEQSNGKDYAQERPAIIDTSTLAIAFSGSSIELDYRKSYLAHEAQFYTAIYEGLFSYHPLTMEPIPAAAEKWLSEDKKIWVFKIRNEAHFSNGDDLSAEDFRTAWFSVIDPKSNSPYSSLFDIISGAREWRLGELNDKDKVGIRALDKKTLQITLVTPAAFFPSMLCHHSFSPIHPSMVGVEDWNKKKIISNGPFYILSNEENKITLARNEEYWGASDVELKKIFVKYAENADESAALWNSGECRWISGDVNIDMLTDLSGIVVNPMFATHYYYICSIRDPWNNHNIRRALMLSLPWEEIRKGYYMPAKTLIYPIQGYPEIAGVDKTDIEEARKILTEAGYEGGAGLPELVVRLTPSRESERIGTIMYQAWHEQLGVPVKIEVKPFGEYFDSLKKADYDVGSSTWIGDFADPYTFLQMWRKDSNLNDAKNNDVDFEKLIDKSMGEEGDKRWKTLSQAEELLLSHGTVLPISYSFAVNIIDLSEIDGWYGNVLDIHPFKYLSFKTYKPLPGVVMAR